MDNNLTISQRNTLDLSINIVDIDTETNEQIIEQIKISQSISSPQRVPEN